MSAATEPRRVVFGERPNPVTIGPFDSGRFVLLLIVFGGGAFYALGNTSPDGVAIGMACAFAVAVRASYLVPGDDRIQPFFSIGMLLGLGIVGLWLAHDILPAGEARTVAIVAIAYFFICHLHGDKFLEAAQQRRQFATPAPIPVVPLPRLRARRRELTATIARLTSLDFFTMTAPDIDAAWARRDVRTLERLLRNGDALNCQSWAIAGASYNSAAALIDLARQQLARALAECEPAVRRHGIDPTRLRVARSGQLTGDAKAIAFERPRSQQIDYVGSASRAFAQTATGRLPWQVALAVTASAVVLSRINESKRLRQLKDIEGEIATMGQAMKGDAGMFTTLIETRLLSQFDWALSIIDQLASFAASLRDAEQSAASNTGELALRLGMAVAEGKMLIAMKAGN